MQLRRLRAELRRLREDAGLTQKVAAQSLDWSVSKLIRIETGAVQVSGADVRAMLHFYGVRDPERSDELLAITRKRDEVWWDEFRPNYGQQFLDFLDYENSATRVRQFISFAVPGLLQTEPYMRTLFEGYMNEPERVERAARIRRRRQELLAPERGKEFWFVIDEGALHRWIGGPAVAREQLEHLRVMAKQPNINIRVVPFSVGMHPGLRGSFTIFEFPSEDEDPIVNLESPHSDVLIRDDLDTTSEFVETYYELDDYTTREGELDTLIDSVVDRMRVGT
ncbi:helix-turn-helix domain-containing protein [Actinophytocola gossypii]|uniref:Helix-turn-helix domain-containing protein n=1 Tax=Actinophytocola gossypii TaxID=2812003 RepID=A0ABT2JGQ3_9PSEU|nr:helix-turn-helix transcriptional regulator [Actinophytocola gossypii]MCT2587038.1 helix-turn-helix domain-containing protein [Actinophytocola gossypii]